MRPQAANTLLIYADQTWNSETALALRRGLQRCGRYDAGLALLVLFRDGRLADDDQRLQAEVEHFASEIGIAAFVNEDVRGAWSQALGMRSGSGSPSWRLIAPDGHVAWAHDGQLSAEVLTAALDTHLQLSPDHAPVEFHSGGRLELGKQVSVITLDPAWFEEVESDCPPIPLGQLGVGDSIISFVQHGSAASMAQLRTLFSRHGQAEHGEGPALVVVVDGADAREIFAIETGVSARREDAEAGD